MTGPCLQRQAADVSSRKRLSARAPTDERSTKGNIIVNADSNLPGFPGFDPSASQSLGYVAAMQEAGIPITLAYIADAHDDHVNGVAFGPGQAGYVAQLKAYDDAFAWFFARLEADHIDSGNTLFVFTADEGDHFAGGSPTPAGCDGVNTPCTYDQIGELDLNLNGLVANQTGNTTPFSIHFDMAPTIYIKGNPAPADPVTRRLERDIAKLRTSSKRSAAALQIPTAAHSKCVCLSARCFLRGFSLISKGTSARSVFRVRYLNVTG